MSDLTHHHLEAFHAAGIKGIPWNILIAWLGQNALPAVLEVLQLIQTKGAGLTVPQLIAWGTAALAAIKAGQPLPPLPTP